MGITTEGVDVYEKFRVGRGGSVFGPSSGNKLFEVPRSSLDVVFCFGKGFTLLTSHVTIL